MVKHVLIALTMVSLVSTFATAEPAAYQKVKAGPTVLKKKNGYWTECSYSAVGENCYTVYAGSSVKSGTGVAGALRPAAVGAGKLSQKNGYYVQCDYSGLGDNCYYVYARARTAKKP